MLNNGILESFPNCLFKFFLSYPLGVFTDCVFLFYIIFLFCSGSCFVFDFLSCFALNTLFFEALEGCMGVNLY
jgi:hypothetical protein